MKRTATIHGCQLQHFCGRCIYFPSKRVFCTHYSDYPPCVHREWERQLDDRWQGKGQSTHCLFSLSQNLLPEPSMASMVSGHRQPAVGQQQDREYFHKLDVFEVRAPYEIHSGVLIDAWCDCKLTLLSVKNHDNDRKLTEVNSSLSQSHFFP